jgi:hypothetical protein
MFAAMIGKCTVPVFLQPPEQMVAMICYVVLVLSSTVMIVKL